MLLSGFLYAASGAGFVNDHLVQLKNETRRDRAFVRRNRRLRRPALRRELEAG